jgi:hypothetical protein
VSDERTEVATRRDSQRPASAFYGKTVELWGCGGLGSWIAEFIARAGARRLILRDSGATSSGLLVRQNYTEDDVGLAKVTQLALISRGVWGVRRVAGEGFWLRGGHVLSRCPGGRGIARACRRVERMFCSGAW